MATLSCMLFCAIILWRKIVEGAINSMIKIDLITGFLGSGKTTFIKKYAKYWMEQGEKVGILENDFGAVNVDALLLQDILGEQCGLEMVAGACDADCHKRRFKTKLIAMGMSGYNRVLVEPSGIYDVDEFFDTLHEEPLECWYEIGTVIAIVDASLPTDLSDESQYLLACQLANAGHVVMSRVQEASEEKVKNTIAYLNKVMEKFKCSREFQLGKEIVCKNWDDFTKDDYVEMASGSYKAQNYAKLWFDQRKTYSSVYFMNLKIEEEALKCTVLDIMNDTNCGSVFRVKGFLKREDGSWIELNATKREIVLKPTQHGQEVIIVIGESLNEHNIRAHLEQ